MNEIVNKFLLAGDKFIPEMHPRFTYSACGSFTKNKERIQKFKETGDSGYSYQNELDEACFQHGMTYGDFKDLKILKISKNLKYDGDRFASGAAIKNKIMSNQELAEELHKPIVRRFEESTLIFYRQYLGC